MKLMIDLEKCQGFANCIMSAPDVFDLNDESKVVLLKTPEPDDWEAVEEAVRACPAEALRIE